MAVTGELNHFTYFSDIEEHFWRKRGAHILVSPLDWAILETWQKAGIPLEAVIAGIDHAFESYARSKRAAGGRPLKSLAYCVDAVLDAAERWKETHAGATPESATRETRPSGEAFSRDELRKFFARLHEKLAGAAVALEAHIPALGERARESAAKVDELAPLLDTPGTLDTEDLERRLTVLEDRMAASLLEHAEEAVLLDVRREMDRALAPYRRKMRPEQIESLERQFLRKRLFEAYNLPRLSLFYM